MGVLNAIPFPVRLAVLVAVGTWFGSWANWAIYRWAWRPRDISPWSPGPVGFPARNWLDRVPVVGWFRLRREAAVHGRGFWVRPLAIEVFLGGALAGLYWWQIDQVGLIVAQLAPLPAGAFRVPPSVLHAPFLGHTILLVLMLVACFIDIDEKIIPDEVTVTGTLLGLILVTLLPTSLLPQVVQRAVAPPVGAPVQLIAGGAGGQLPGGQLYVEPVTAVAPGPWPAVLGGAPHWPALALGLACFWLWCFALIPRIWRGRRGAWFALRLIAACVVREVSRPPLLPIAAFGTLAIAGVWWRGGAEWIGLLSGLIGMVGSGGIVWAVRLIGTAALRREAMGFGDVTLMMMIGTYLGWQAGLVLFFLAPLAGIVVGLLQLAIGRGDVIPYGPFLCLAAASVVVKWGPIWVWAQPIFAIGWLVPAALAVCLLLLGVMLAVWSFVKGLLFGR